MRTTRAVVIDEDRNEASSLLQALGQIGMGAIYFAGDNPDLLPLAPLHGIRLVFLDLNLINQPLAKQYIPHAVMVLQRCVHFSPRTTGIICWTRHTDEIQSLLQELKEKQIEPAFVVHLDNKVQLTTSGAGGIQNVMQQISHQLIQNPGQRLLFDWEQLVHDAATATTSSLMQLSQDDSDLIRLLGTIALANADESIGSPSEAVNSLSSGLVAVHHDSVESLIDSSKHDKDLVANNLFQSIAEVRKNRLTLEQCAKLNSVLLTTEGPVLRPGNVYLTQENGIGGIDPKHLPRFVSGMLDLPMQKDGKPYTHPKAESVPKAARPVCIEITPACDHAGNKSHLARVLCGILVRIDGNAVKESDLKLPPSSRLFAKELEPLWIDNEAMQLKGVFKLMINARCLLSISLNELRQKKAVFRLRYPVVCDIQAWFASHAARPGYVSVH